MYSTSDEVLSDRIRWAFAVFMTLLRERIQPGDPNAGESPSALRQAIDARSQTPDVRVVPLEWLRMQLALSSRELDAVWLLVCCEIDPVIAKLARGFGTADCPDLSVALLQRLAGIGAAQLERLVDLALIETTFDSRVPLHRRPVRANDRVVELARGELRLDREIAILAKVVVAGPEVGVPANVASALVSGAIVVALGGEGSGRATLLQHAAKAVARGTLDFRSDALARDSAAATRQLRAICREAQLFGLLPLMRDASEEHRDVIDRALATHFTGPILVTARASIGSLRSRPVVEHLIAPISADARAKIWRSALPDASADLITEAAQRYAIGPGAIVAACNDARASAISIDSLHRSLRAHFGRQLGPLATRIETTQTWDDLVLPREQFERIAELVARVRHRGTVLDDWGFRGKLGKGLGVATLLSGPPGTGKTMVAGLVAQELGLDLYQVDLSRIVSKYIGETEKQLAQLFDAAESGHAILLFDEADSLFAKRTDVKSSNDRYANLEVNYLLQRMEAFNGISILTTNHETAIDDAFRRRLALHVRFPMPDEEQRSELWRRMIPSAARIDGTLDFDQLGREFAVTGGYIRNAVLRAAYLAADRGSGIDMMLLRRAAHDEIEAMGKVVFRRAA